MKKQKEVIQVKEHQMTREIKKNREPYPGINEKEGGDKNDR